MIAVATMMLFAFALLLAIGVMATTVLPELDRITRLLRYGPMVSAVETVRIRDSRVRSVMPRRARAAPQAWREAA